MGTKEILIIIIPLMMLATQISRLLPLFLSSIQMPQKIESWLGHVPIAILTAMIIPEFVVKDETGFTLNTFFIIAAVICFYIGFKTRHLLWTTAAGILITGLLRYFL